MKVSRTLAATQRQRDLNTCVLAIGTFDGIHIGHQALFAEVKKLSDELGIRSTVFSFEPMPSEFLFPDNPTPRLTRFREKFKLIEALGMDELFCPRFDQRMQQMSPDDFIREMLVEGLGTRHLVVGQDFRFAADRSGTVKDLEAAGEQYGFGVTVVPVISSGGHRVSSSAIREALKVGDFDKARAMLGRHYSMSGRVIYGQQLGRALGFPTVNIRVKRRKTAMMGIFAVRILGLPEGIVNGVANLGTRPTVGGGGEVLLEVFIFDFHRDIYGEYLDVEFIAHLRAEEKFPDLNTMIAQMHKDVAVARGILAAH